MFTRSQSPAQGVGKFAATRDAFAAVKAPNPSRITIVTIE